MRTYRHRTVLLPAAATVALALSLTACGGGDSADAKAKATVAATASEKATENTADKGEKSDKGDKGTEKGAAGKGEQQNGTAGAKTAGGSTATGAGKGKSTPVCTTKDVKVTAARQDGPPYTHIVLTAKNTSGHSCRLDGYPRIQFLESHKQDVPPVAKSKPAAPVVLTAGAPAYALVRLSDGGVDEENEPVTAFSLMLEGGNGQLAVRAPGSGGIAVDPAKAATGYWTPELRNGADDF